MASTRFHRQTSAFSPGWASRPACLPPRWPRCLRCHLPAARSPLQAFVSSTRPCRLARQAFAPREMQTTRLSTLQAVRFSPEVVSLPRLHCGRRLKRFTTLACRWMIRRGSVVEAWQEPLWILRSTLRSTQVLQPSLHTLSGRLGVSRLTLSIRAITQTPVRKRTWVMSSRRMHDLESVMQAVRRSRCLPVE